MRRGAGAHADDLHHPISHLKPKCHGRFFLNLSLLHLPLGDDGRRAGGLHHALLCRSRLRDVCLQEMGREHQQQSGVVPDGVPHLRGHDRHLAALTAPLRNRAARLPDHLRNPLLPTCHHLPLADEGQEKPDATRRHVHGHHLQPPERHDAGLLDFLRILQPTLHCFRVVLF